MSVETKFARILSRAIESANMEQETMTANDFYLGDDGTLDTVIVCSKCGQEMRFNYAGDYREDNAYIENFDYGDFVQECIEECAESHECEAPQE